MSQGKRSQTDKQKADRDNHANQLNPRHPAYWESRGLQPPPEPPGNVGDDFEQFGPLGNSD